VDAAVIGWILLISLISYFLPTIVATVRPAKRRAVIFAINLVFGWTIIGWIATLIWAMSQPAQPQSKVVDSRPLDSDSWFIDASKASQSSDPTDRWVLGQENLFESPRNR
jgi:hypothetical protein